MGMQSELQFFIIVQKMEDSMLMRAMLIKAGYRFNPIILEYSLYFKPYCSIALYFITMSRQTVGHWSAKPCCEIH